MNIYKTTFSVVLVLSVLISSTVISNASEGRFVAIDVVEYDQYGDQKVDTCAFYTDGEYLYASIETLERYTLYDYDDHNNAFVRVGQDYRFSLSKTTLDFEKKKAKVKILNGEEEYKLHDVFNFGGEYYLPLDQMCAFLMASISVTNNNLTIRNSGFSIADAAYRFNNYSYVFNYYDIVDGIFAGNENLYFSYCIIGFYGSSIFGLRIKNLDIITQSGDIEYYQDFLQNCITDYDEYLKTQASTNSFEKQLNKALSLEQGLNGLIGILKNGTTISKTAYETFTDTSDITNLDIEYINLKNWNGVFDGLSKSLDYMEYFTKAVSMTEDHKLMIRECDDDATNNAGFQLKTAIANNFHQFGANSFATISSKIAETLIEEVPEEAIKKFGAQIIPYVAVIKAVNIAFKLLGYDLSDNSQYSIMLKGLANSYLSDRYSILLNEAGKTKEASEKFRRSAIFMLLASKNAYESGNALDKKLDSSGTLFNDEIDVVCARLNLFYRAVESSCYENIESVDDVFGENQANISGSGIINNSSVINSPLIANEKDFEYLEEIMFDCSIEYDVNSDNAVGNAYRIVLGVMGGMYSNIYFDGAYDLITNVPDPKRKFYSEFTGYAYYKFPAEKVDWILKNVLNIKPDQSYIGMFEWKSYEKVVKTTLSYYDNGCYYSYYTETGSVTEKMQVLSWSLDSSGRYEIKIGCFEYDGGKPTYTITVTTVLKEVDGKRIWSIYKIQNDLGSTYDSTYQENISKTSKPTTTNSTAVINKGVRDLKELYRQFFFEKYTNKNLVYLFDVTHDGKVDMIVFKVNPQNNISFNEYIVYTASSGEVREIYRAEIPANRTNIMLVETGDGSNLVYEFRGIWQGIGEACCEEFYITDSGEKKKINLIEQKYGGDSEVLDSLYSDAELYLNYIDENNILADEEYYGKIERRYGKKFSNAYMLYSTDVANYATKRAESTASENF